MRYDSYDKDDPLKRWAGEDELLASVPERALIWLRRSLSGPWTSQTSHGLGVTIWTFVGSYHAALGGYLVYCFANQLHTDDTYVLAVEHSAIPVWAGVGVLLGEASYAMVR